MSGAFDSGLFPRLCARYKYLFHYHQVSSILNNNSMDNARRLLCVEGDFSSSCKHLAESVSATEVIYGPTSIELANELVKYAEVCANARQSELARSVADRALRILTINYGADCDAANDLKRLVEALHLT
jgi:hypothetical protein